MNYKSFIKRNAIGLCAAFLMICSVITNYRITVYAETDTVKPVIGDIIVNTPEITVPGELNFTVPITEDGSGLQSIVLRLSIPGTNFVYNKTYNYDVGNYSGDYEITYPIAKDFPIGTWMIQVMASDYSNNWTSYKTFFKSFVTCEPEKDKTSPVINDAYLSESELDAPSTLKLYLDITEEDSGIKYIKVNWKSDDDSVGIIAKTYSYDCETNKSDVYELPLLIDEDCPSTTLSLQSIYVCDGEDNELNYVSDLTCKVNAYVPPVPVITGIEIIEPNKLIYNIGDVADYTGLTVYSIYDDGEKSETLDYKITGFDTYSAGFIPVYISYPKDNPIYTLSFMIEIKDMPEEKPDDEDNVNNGEQDSKPDLDPDESLNEDLNEDESKLPDNSSDSSNTDLSPIPEEKPDTSEDIQDDGEDLDISQDNTPSNPSKDNEIERPIPPLDNNGLIENDVEKEESNNSNDDGNNQHESTSNTDTSLPDKSESNSSSVDVGNDGEHYNSVSGNSSSGSTHTRTDSNSNQTSNITTLPSVYSGTWEFDSESNRWKFYDDNGSPVNSRWVFNKDKWYLIGQDGYMTTNWQLVNSQWYFMSENGDMLTGWNYISGEWYFLDTKDGYMWKNTYTPDGFWVNESGKFEKR